MATESEWWVVIDQEPTGPYTQSYVRSAWRSGRIQSTDLACPVGTTHWRRLADWPQFAKSPVPPATQSDALRLQSEAVWEERILKAIGSYYLIINPILWLIFIGFGSFGPRPFRAGTAAAICQWLLDGLFDLASLSALAWMTLGGWKLRQHEAIGVRWITRSVFASWILDVVGMVIQFWIERSAPPDSFTTDWHTFHGSALGNAVTLVLLATCVSAWTAQMMSLLWLWLRPPAAAAHLPVERENHHAASV